jgi:hypothetical protein
MDGSLNILLPQQEMLMTTERGSTENNIVEKRSICCGPSVWPRRFPAGVCERIRDGGFPGACAPFRVIAHVM